MTSAPRVSRACTALATYSGNDRYLLHLREVLDHAARGMDFRIEPTVTSVIPAIVLPPQKPGRNTMRWVGLAIAFSLLAAAAIIAKS